MEGREAGGAGAPGSHIQQQPGFSNLLQRPPAGTPPTTPVGVHAPAALRPGLPTPMSLPGPSPMDVTPPHPVGTMTVTPAGMGIPGHALTMTPGGPSPAAISATRGPGGESVKRKRGRPRKYGVNDGAPGSSIVNNSVPPSSVSLLSSPPAEKRGRGRPPGSGKKQQLAALGSSGQSFTPHVITIAAGEDVAVKIHTFVNLQARHVSIISATGAVSNAQLRQGGGVILYEGRYEILSLAGTFLIPDNGAMRNRTSGMSVSLSGVDGKVVGGGVAGVLVAASPVQVVVGSFIAEGVKVPSQTGNGDTPGSAALVARTPKAEPVKDGNALVGGPGEPELPPGTPTPDLVPQPGGWGTPGPPALEVRRTTDMNESPQDR